MSRRNKLIAIMGALFLSLTPNVPAENLGDDQETEMAKNTVSSIESLPLAALEPDYRVGVNDVLAVHVWKEPELSRMVPVRPDGRISLPLVGDVLVEGKTATELRKIISERLQNYVTAPEVTIIVQEINSRRYFVIGEIQNPGVFSLTVPTTVMQALAMAGGFREFADTDDIFILRRLEDDRTMRIKFSYKDWVKDKKAIEHLELQNGDVIVVP